MKINISQVAADIDNIIPRVTDIRRHLHANPELSLKEFNTSEFVRNQLNSLNLEISPPVLDTDVIAFINSKNPGKNVTLRADMDALPVHEQSDLPYCSLNSGIMHACGHDGHTAILLGAATILEKYKDQLSGSVRFVFQPGEEIVAAGNELIEKGILNNPKPQAVLALHSWPGYALGSICSKPGPIMAAADFFEIIVKGKGGHGSKPEESIDPILTASKILNNLYLLPSRKFRALDSVVISVCKMIGGTNANVIPDEVIMEGSTRYISEDVGQIIPKHFEHAIKAECENSGLLLQ